MTMFMLYLFIVLNFSNIFILLLTLCLFSMSSLFSRLKPLTPELNRTNYSLEAFPPSRLKLRRLYPRRVNEVNPSDKFHISNF